MRRMTPAGLLKPWKTEREIALVVACLEDGIPAEELEDVVIGSAELVAGGREDPRFWRVDNLFGRPGPARWAAEVAAHRLESSKRADADRRRSAELEAYEQTAARVVGQDFEPGAVVVDAGSRFGGFLDDFRNAKAQPGQMSLPIGGPYDAG